jgi:transcriptional regulator with XRE-family HTH domain
MGAVPKFPGLGDRLAARLRARGYTKGDRLDVLRFALDFRYNPASIYAWLKGATPLYEALERLATDCQCELGWLLLGDRRLDPERPQILTRVTKKGR